MDEQAIAELQEIVANAGIFKWPLYAIIGIPLWAMLAGLSYLGLLIASPIPRAARKTEKEYVAVLPDGSVSAPTPLPSWHEDYMARKMVAKRQGKSTAATHTASEPEVFMTLVVPAFNEEDRLVQMLEEAVVYLEKAYPTDMTKGTSNGTLPEVLKTNNYKGGWEILVVSDGSTDKTADVALDFAKKHKLFDSATENGATAPVSKFSKTSQVAPVGSPAGTLRVIKLENNRGKGGATMHGMRHARGEYVVFADADGASRFSDLAGLVDGCEKVRDSQGRAVGIGSRAHLVGSEAVVKRSFLRNALMHTFHVFLWLMTPPKTASIKDTQCGFKLFTRSALPYIVPYMHNEGWIFDVEMLMLAEAAKIPMIEVSIGWHEVKGSKLNVVWDSLGMAWGLAVLRLAWMFGIYSRDF
ncbi:hypothetical protein CAC42_7410 [Sphaceloma murrayae]|uniref:dolichyl-phosphate beta-glucosyltransferase n=1 Tax=Sphaceloma murrayae TaxID=2082308 RepID=A0A2K1QWX8_9PEZI|nr:hypothetical protein CAC42_7410 [Sphaceloma murrayae]